LKFRGDDGDGGRGGGVGGGGGGGGGGGLRMGLALLDGSVVRTGIE